MSMTHYKTLEELAGNVAENIRNILIRTPWLKDSIAAAECREHVLQALQSATAAQQREMERLSEQLRTEREKYKELFMKAQDLVKELKSE